MELQFERKAFGKGDEVVARLDLHSLENQALANYEFSFKASLDGVSFLENKAKTDQNGRAYLTFSLPKDLATNDGLLNVLIPYHNQMESISRAIPIVLGKIDLQFFPEGGDAVAGLTNTIAFKAVNEFGKAADIEGVVRNSKQEIVANFSSYHQGMGAFQMATDANETYHAEITKPSNIAVKYALPTSTQAGYTLHVNSVTDKTVSLTLHTSFFNQEEKSVFLVGQLGDKLFFQKEILLTKGEKTIEIPVAKTGMGVARFTLFDADQQPICERLSFLHRDKSLNISIKSNKTTYLPREKVTLALHVSDAEGKPVQGNFSMAVADDKQLTFADDKQATILASLFLENELNGKIEEPNFYFDKKEPKSNQALDYLLMTQGWRRFAWKTILENQDLIYDDDYNYDKERLKIEGTVKDEHFIGINKAKIILHPEGLETFTDKNGKYCFENLELNLLEKNNRWLSFQRKHYISQTEGLYLNQLKTSKNTRLSIAKYKLHPNNHTVLKGTITDALTGETVIGASVAIYKGQTLLTGEQTDIDGNYSIPVNPGKYDVKVTYVGYAPSLVTKVRILPDKVNLLDFKLVVGDILGEVCIKEYKKPLIQQDNTTSGMMLTSAEIAKLPVRDVSVMAGLTKGIGSVDGAGDLKINGSRSDWTDYFVGSVPINTESLPPSQEIEMLEEVLNNIIIEKISEKANEMSSDTSYYSYKRFHYSMYNMAGNVTFHAARQFYAPVYDPKNTPTLRTDFRSTIYWNANIQTDAAGDAKIEFCNSDAITAFRVTVEGLGFDGSVGHGEQKYNTQLPFSMVCKVPNLVLTDDVLRIPVTLTNNTDKALEGEIDVTASSFLVQKDSFSLKMPSKITLNANEIKTIYLTYTVINAPSREQALRIQFVGGGNTDAFSTNLKMMPRGFPVTKIYAGQALKNDFSLSLMQPIDGTVQAKVFAYPSVLEELLTGMEKMLQQPHGCFEQVSSSNYPNLLVLDFLHNT
ncbi:MAG: hypothetical protein RLZZ292_3547, partial [Bacteroidota bacterium]